MEKVTFINSKGQSIQLGNDAPFILTSIENTGAVNANIQSQKSPYQDGESYIDNTLEPRYIPIKITILAESIDEMMDYRRKTINVFNSKLGLGDLIYEIGGVKRTIRAMSELAPFFPDAGDFKDAMQEGLINLYAPNPFWLDPNTYREEIAIWRGSFEFPLEIPFEGIEMGYREPSLIVNIENKGDVQCGMTIQFKALASVKNPSIFNINTREYFKITKIMEAGEIIIVTTQHGNKKVISNKNGIIRSEKDWDYTSTFLQLDVGDNLLRYDAEDGIDNLEMSISYIPQYLGV